MQFTDRRKYLRFDAFLDGTFQMDDGKKGLTMFTNFSRDGLRASLNRKVGAGDPIELEIRFPGGFVSISAKGKVIWVQESQKDWTYDFDAGIQFDDIDRWDRARIMDYAYEHWRHSKEKKLNTLESD